VRANQEQREDAERARQQQQQQRQQQQEQREDAERARQQQQQQLQQQHLQRDQEAGQRETMLNKLGLHLEYESLKTIRARKRLVDKAVASFSTLTSGSSCSRVQVLRLIKSCYQRAGQTDVGR
jgi:hypothetical protein